MRPKQLSVRQREAAFVFWAKCQNLRETAREFKVSPTTIHRYRSLDKWDDRLPAVLDKVRAQSENQAARAISNNLDAAKQILARVVKQLLDEKGKLDADVGDFVKLAQYVDAYEGTAPGVVAAELLNDIIADISRGSSADRTRTVTNALAGIGITDRGTVNRAAKILLGGIYSQN